MFENIVYITSYNFERAIPKDIDVNIKEILLLFKNDEILKMFNHNELSFLLRLHFSLENPEQMAKIYANVSDDERPEKYSAYHLNTDCIELNKNYLDYSINTSEKSLRLSISNEVRNIFKDYVYNTLRSIKSFDFKSNQVVDIDKNGVEISTPEYIAPDLARKIKSLRERFDRFKDPESQSVLGEIFDLVPNSGFKQFNNTELSEIESKIGLILTESSTFRYSDGDVTKKISSKTFADIYKLKRMSDDDLKKWGEYKESIYSLMKEYIWIKLNPKNELQKTVLDSIGFKQCKRCSLKK